MHGAMSSPKPATPPWLFTANRSLLRTRANPPAALASPHAVTGPLPDARRTPTASCVRGSGGRSPACRAWAWRRLGSRSGRAGQPRFTSTGSSMPTAAEVHTGQNVLFWMGLLLIWTTCPHRKERERPLRESTRTLPRWVFVIRSPAYASNLIGSGTSASRRFAMSR